MLSTAELVDALRRYSLLTPAQLADLDRDLPDLGAESEVLAARFIGLGWLTKYQVDRLLPGRGATLVLGPYVAGPAAGPISVPVIRMMPLTESQPGESLPGASVLINESIRRQRPGGGSGGMWLWIVAGCVGVLLAVAIVVAVVLAMRL